MIKICVIRFMQNKEDVIWVAHFCDRTENRRNNMAIEDEIQGQQGYMKKVREN